MSFPELQTLEEEWVWRTEIKSSALEGREMGTYCICVADSLCCRAEANTLLWGNYTSIKMFEKKRVQL